MRTFTDTDTKAQALVKFNQKERIDVRDYTPDLTGATSSRTALNSAIADCITNQMPLFLANGHYKVNGSTWDATTNSLLTGSIATGVTAGQVQIAIIGQSLGRIDYDDNSYIGGVVIDASGATGASGTMPSVLSFSAWAEPTPYTFDPDQFVDANPILRNITFLVPNNSTFGAVNLHNCLSCDVAQVVAYGASDGSGNPPVCTHAAAVALIPPCHLNRKVLSVRDCRFQGFYDGLWSGEHLVVSGVDSSLNKNGLRLRFMAHPTKGDICIETCERQIVVDTAATSCPIRLVMEGEIGAAGPYTAAGSGAGVYDPNDYLTGILEYRILSTDDGIGATLPTTGCSGVRLDNLANVGQFTAGASVPTDNIAQYNLANLTDSKGSYNLTDHGTITFTTGKVGNCAVFNGTTQYATSATLSVANGSFTVCLWVKFSTTQNSYIVCQMDGTANRWQIYCQTDNTVIFAVIPLLNAGAANSVTAVLAPDTWHFIAATWDNTTFAQRVRANSDAWVSQTLGDVMNTFGTPAVIGFAGRGNDGAAPLAGSLDAFRVYDRVLTNGEIDAIYNGGTGTEA